MMDKMADSSLLTLDIVKTREEYLKRVTEYRPGSKSTYEWRNRKWVQNKIRDIETMTTRFTRLYKVEETCGVKVLKIVGRGRANNMQVIPIEDYFDVIDAAHIFTEHGTRSKMKNYFQNRNLYVPFKAVIHYLELCKACVALKKPKFKIYQGYLELIDMSDTPDGKYKLVMHYRSLKLKRVFLRPLCSSNAVEIAEHLVEIFGQIGPPRVLRSPNKSFTEALIQRLATVYPDSKINPGKAMDLEEKTKEIKANIKNWIGLSFNERRAWSKGVYELSGLECNGKKLEQRKQQIEIKVSESDNKNLPGLSSVRQECQDMTSKKEAHELYLEENIFANEVLQFLKPTKTYTKINPETVPLKSLRELSTPQTENKVCKTYTRGKEENSQKIIPVVSNEDELLGKKALCVDRNLKDVVLKPSKKMKKRHALWNSALDLPHQTASNGNNVIEINSIFNDADFGLMQSKQFPNLHDDVICDQYGQIKRFHLLDKASSDALESKNAEKKEPYFKTQIEFSALDGTKRKDEKHLFVIADDFNEEKPCLDFSSSESQDIKKELFAFDVPTTSIVSTNSIKVEEEMSFGAIVKVESMVE